MSSPSLDRALARERWALLAAHADLPGAGRLLDPRRRSELLGDRQLASRVRIKPGASIMLAHRAASSPATAEVGWALLVASPDKRDGVLRRAGRSGAPVTEHDPVPDETERQHPGAAPFLLTGGIDADPRIGRSVGAVLRRHRTAEPPRVLSYNPARHAVLEMPGTADVLRIAAVPLDRLLTVDAAWRRRGLPVVSQQRWRDRRNILVSEHWGSGDLAGSPRDDGAAAIAAALGETIAALHRGPAHDRGLPPARTGGRIPASIDAAGDLLPYRAAQLHRLAEQLRHRLPARADQVLIHGDLAPDQVLVSGPEIGPTFRVVDLDRSGLGPRGADLGSWIAWCLARGDDRLARAFLHGYSCGAPLPGPVELAAWTARALVAGALDPMRRCAGDWVVSIEQRLDLAEEVLEAPDRIPAPSAPSSPPVPSSLSGPMAPARSRTIPDQVEHDGTSSRVRRAWADDGRGNPLELEGPRGVRAARLDPRTRAIDVFAAGTDPRLPALERVLTEHPGAAVVSHRPGKRAVVRTGTDEAPDGTTYVKIVRAGRTRRIRDALTRAAAFDGPFRTPAVLTTDEETITFAELPGATLHEPLPTADGTWRRAWSDVLDAWSAALTRRGADETVHGPEEETAVLVTWRDRAAAVDPDGAELRARAVEAARGELARIPGPRHPVLIHRDLHDKQLLWHPRLGPGLLDVDTASAGDPALDLGNMRAHATWRERQELWSPEHARIVREQIDDTADRTGLDPQHLRAYEAAALARLACVYAFRPQWWRRARELAADRASTDHRASTIPTPDERNATR